MGGEALRREVAPSRVTSLLRYRGIRSLTRAALDAAAEALWPTRCVSCDMPGELLCEDCRMQMPWISQRWACPTCGAPFGWLTCTGCEGDWEPRAVICALGFGQIASQMVACLKDQNELRLAPVNAAAMACALDEARNWPAGDGKPRFDPDDTDAICFVPATAQACVRRGFDHMELVARELSALLGLPLADVLKRASRQDQRTLDKDERARNLSGAVGVVEDVAGMRLLLADDVVTTGASLRECARALMARGAASVTCCALTRVW
ncbi:MAG: ComF family protein [Atopobiaceae bacterium]|nr:ComF family protein [Atopobiaceae bacterium]MBR3314608.1 ComF family protein [Atopobiaceae bacterium]